MKSKKIIASLLMVVFMFSILPTVAFAKEVEKSSFEQDFLSYFQEVMRTQGLNSIVLDKNLSNYKMKVTRVYIGDYNFAKPAPGQKPEAKPEVKPEPKPEVKPQPKPEVKPEPKPEVKPEPKPEVKPEPKPEVKPEPKPEVKPQPTPTPGEEDNGAVNANNFEQEMLTLVNAERAKNGVKPLVMDTKIVEVARLKSKDMIDKNYFSHTSPTYGSPFDMMKSFGITYKTAGENIAGNQSVQRAHQALMNSEGHRKNILNPNFTHIGIGIVEGGPYGLMFTQMFVGR